MSSTITIHSRFNGPPDSGNGGYVCGLVADFIEGNTVEITLRKPPPVNVGLAVRREGEAVRLLNEETLIAEGRPAELRLEVPEPPSLSEAKAAVHRYAGFEDHIFTTCFVCGPERPEPDGLHIYPGPTGAGKLVAAPWRPAEDLAGENGRVSNRYLWAALDCPGAFAIHEEAGMIPIVLGRLTATIAAAVRANQEYIVTGWQIGQEGRKYFTGTAVFGEDGRLCASGYAVWIALRQL